MTHEELVGLAKIAIEDAIELWIRDIGGSTVLEAAEAEGYPDLAGDEMNEVLNLVRKATITYKVNG